MRGMLTPKSNDLAQKFLGREISVRELRLYPYLDFCLKNSQGVERSKINPEERELLFTLEEEGHIVMFDTPQFSVTRDFYYFMQAMLADTYCSLMSVNHVRELPPKEYLDLMTEEVSNHE